ncbi:TRAP transporter small permease [Pseudomonas sp. KSR10]|jgi:TRAP-type C4-dicarboxylate transport system permease small subunit|uniref:TRAP transporter small permease protein n=1 Tax=Stutzerimonas stutzeri TaxID=316 RepID=A0A0D9AHK7_STUST|nr:MULTISPECIES: TRAP transporter small permease [Pseudomonadaceae]KJH80478.1 TRAP dicarboxylate transporter subunit DctQ [Stutzerimonas stutzeri]MCG6541978.1 TRAP transporter small permease [Pseudomonas sp. KSR10]
MNESLSFPTTPQHAGFLRRVLDITTRSFALAGGLILLGLINMSLVSIVGRKLFSTPIRGDMEIMEVGAAVAIAAFLPLCEFRGNHLKADAFTLKAPLMVRRVLDGLAHFLCFFAAAILVWRTSLQALESLEYGDVTTLLSIPLWIPLALIVPSLALLALCALARVADIIRGAGVRA